MALKRSRSKLSGKFPLGKDRNVCRAAMLIIKKNGMALVGKMKYAGGTHPKQIPPLRMAGITPVGKQNLQTVAIPMAP
jgi:hypothetical protein